VAAFGAARGKPGHHEKIGRGFAASLLVDDGDRSGALVVILLYFACLAVILFVSPALAPTA
jgi:hypothetical protein